MHSERILNNIRLKENQQYSVEAGFRYPKLKKKKKGYFTRCCGVVVHICVYDFLTQLDLAAHLALSRLGATPQYCAPPNQTQTRAMNCSYASPCDTQPITLQLLWYQA
jgi:hypothetical protein